MAFPLALDKELNIRLEIPFYRQEHSLSCEITALRMALNYYGLRLFGKIIWSADKFIKNWASLDNRAVVVY